MIEPITIEPEAIYDDSALYQLIGLTPYVLSKARRDEALRHARKGRRTLYLGKWILEWLEASVGFAGQPESSVTARAVAS